MSTVYVLCHDDDSPTGGVMKLYDLVDILNENSIDSFIVHETEGFRVTWFANSTKVIYYKSIEVKKSDFIIIPEIWADKVLTIWPGVKKIIFCQNSFYILSVFDSNLLKAREVYLHEDVLQVIVISDYDTYVVNWLFPSVKLERVYLGIDQKIFYNEPNKLKLIAFMPRKGFDDFLFVHNLLLAKNSLKDFAIQMINNMSHEKCGEILRSASIFLSFASNEGFGLPSAEAMACGCIVIGYHGEGGREFFMPDLTFNINQGDLIVFATTIHNVIKQYDINPTKMLEMGKKASDLIHENYSIENQQRSILNIFKQLL